MRCYISTGTERQESRKQRRRIQGSKDPLGVSWTEGQRKAQRPQEAGGGKTSGTWTCVRVGRVPLAWCPLRPRQDEPGVRERKEVARGPTTRPLPLAGQRQTQVIIPGAWSGGKASGQGEGERRWALSGTATWKGPRGRWWRPTWAPGKVQEMSPFGALRAERRSGGGRD